VIFSTAKRERDAEGALRGSTLSLRVLGVSLPLCVEVFSQAKNSY
jgi:hypothetical protein